MKAIIFGITGQDGTLLANYLLKMGFQIVGTSRKSDIGSINNIKIYEVDVLSFTQIFDLIKKETPDIIYNLSGQTSVGKSFVNPRETYLTIVNTTLYILDSIRLINPGIKYFNASSSECFGISKFEILDEESPFNPVSPYATAKLMAHNLANNYRNTYGLFICTGIMSNHESYLRSTDFISMKIIEAAYNISNGFQEYFEVGDISIIRDWGWAEDYIEAMYLMMIQKDPDDYILATGRSISLEEFINYTFNKFNLDYKKFIRINQFYTRKNEVPKVVLNPQKSLENLGWKAKNSVYEVIDKLIDYRCKKTY